MKNLVVMSNLFLFLLSVNYAQSMDTNAINRDKKLHKIVEKIEANKDIDQQCVTVMQLVKEGANPNITSMGTSLLHKALIINNKDLIETLLDNDADYNEIDCIFKRPIFFDALTEEIVQLFIDKGVNLNRTNGNDHNVLWYLIDPKFSPELMRFYVEKNVNVEHVCIWEGSCVLHSFAEQHIIANKDDFLCKARLLLEASPTMVNTINKKGETPIVDAQKTMEMWGEEYPLCVDSLQKLIKLFKGYEQKS